MRAKLILVRHGETLGESSVRYHGRGDISLSALGPAQMRAASRFLAHEEFVCVFSSPLRRAVESANLITGPSASIIKLNEFAEIDFGLFEGLTAEEIRLRYPDHFVSWRERRFERDYAYPMGESRAAFVARVARGVDRMLAAWRATSRSSALSGSALLAAHRGVIRAVAQRLAGVEPLSELGSIQILAYDGHWHAQRVDVLDHVKDIAS
jgi:broad specificity phosphatase PhoE